MSEQCYKLIDLIDITEELLAISKALPDGYHLRDPLDRKAYFVEVQVVRKRIEDILKQLWTEQKLEK